MADRAANGNGQVVRRFVRLLASDGLMPVLDSAAHGFELQGDEAERIVGAMVDALRSHDETRSPLQTGHNPS